MTQEAPRLRRLLADEGDDCCESDVTDRIEELEALTDTVPADADRDVAALQTLGDETRYRIVRLLTEAAEELCVCEFSPILDVSTSAISHAFSDLTEAGLVTRRKDGKWHYYRSTDRAERLIEALDATRGDER